MAKITNRYAFEYVAKNKIFSQLHTSLLTVIYSGEIRTCNGWKDEARYNADIIAVKWNGIDVLPLLQSTENMYPIDDAVLVDLKSRDSYGVDPEPRSKRYPILQTVFTHL